MSEQNQTPSTRPNAGQPTPYQLLQETLQQNQQLIRLLNMKHPSEAGVKWDIMRLSREAADARVAEAVANAEAQRLRERDRFRNNLAFTIGLIAILFLLAAPTIRWWNQFGQPAVTLAVAPIGIVWNVGTAVATHWVCESGILHPQARYEVCPRPVYAPLPAPVVQPQAMPELGAYHNTPLVPDQGIRDEAYEVNDKWLGSMTRMDRLEGSYIVFTDDYTFSRNFFGWTQSVFVRFPDSNIVADLVPECGEGQTFDSTIHHGMRYVIMDVNYSPEGTVRSMRILGICAGWEQ